MKVIHLYDGHEKVHGGRGSVPDVVWNIARHTAASGHDVTVMERQWQGLEKESEQEGVRFERLSLRTGAAEPWDRIPYEMLSTPVGLGRLLVDRTNFAANALRRLRSMDYDIVHVHLPFAANVIATVAPRVRRRMVYTAHIGETEKRVLNPIFSPDVHLAKRVGQTIVLNPEMEAAFRSRGVPNERLTTIPNGVNVNRFDDVDPGRHEVVRSSYGLGDERTVLFVGTITPRKGILDLIQAVDRLSGDEALKDVQFVLVGKTDLDEEYTQEVQSEIDRRGLAETITLTGFIPNEDVEALYDLADLFVLPSYEEGSSVAVTEAIASETPIVATNIGGTAQQIVDGTHGFLVEPGDTDQLADKIEFILTDTIEYLEMKDAVSRRAMEFSWEQITERIADTYRMVGTK